MSIDAMKQAFKNIYGHEPQEDSFLWAGFQDGYKAAIEAAERQEPVCDLGTTRIGDTWYRTQGGYLMGEIPPQPAIPDGWQLVPVEPTSEMSSFANTGVHWQIAERIYKAMLAAAKEIK